MNGSSGFSENEKEIRSAYIHELFEKQVLRTPQQVAMSYAGGQCTYAELNRRADRLAALLSETADTETIIGISTTRRPEMIAGILAILKSGNAYLPLDPSFPAERLTAILSDARVTTVLCPEPERDIFRNIQQELHFPSEHPDDSTEHPLRRAQRAPLAYVLYTSGSSGKPKGVAMPHAGLVNLLDWQKKNSTATTGTRTLQFAPAGFDVSFQEIFSTLTTGGELCLIDDDIRLDPFRLLEFIGHQNIARIFLPFVALQFLTDTAVANAIFPACLKEVITAGEQLKITPQIIRFFGSIPGSVLFNQYGPTETHVVTALRLEGNPALWPALPSIGKPIDGVEIFLLDENRRLAETGVAGEIVVRGTALADGYLNQSVLTGEKFMYWDHPAQGDSRIYRTGDLGRWLPDGSLEFLGRTDDQVKIRGYRIEPGEIEVVLTHLPGVQQVAVVVREDQPGQKKLVAYLVASGVPPDIQTIRKGAAEKLPDYMMPSAFCWIDELPRTVSGKIDRKKLPVPATKRPRLSVPFKQLQTKTEQTVAEIWSRLLALDSVGADDNLFELGGNSLLALQSISALKQCGFELPITRLYQYATVGSIASYLDNSIAEPIELKRNSETRNHDDVAIIAMAVRLPGASTIDEFWKLLKEGKETITFFSPEELDRSVPESLRNNPEYVRARGVIEAETFDADFFGINPRLASLMDPQQRIFMEIAWEALENSGYLPSTSKETIAVFAGTGNNTYYLNNVQSNTELINGIGSFQVMTANEKDYIATRTAYHLNLKGPAVSIHSACSTSLLAICEAVESIRNGQCDLALAGGVAITVPVRSGQLYQEGGMYSRDGHNRSFDADAAGTVFSDGAGIVLLKNLEQAKRDGDKIYSVIKGIGLNNDGGDKGSFTAPSAEGQAGAIRRAIADAGIDPANISYIEAHGTATPLGDPIEIEGLERAFGPQEKKQYCALGSVKSNFGHCTAAAGVAGLIKTTLALQHQKIPASIHYQRPNPHIQFGKTPFYINRECRAWEGVEKRIAGVSSFGVGGTNVHVILEEYLEPVDEPATDEPSLQVVRFSAKTENSLAAYAGKLADFIAGHETISAAALAQALHTKRADFNVRHFVIADQKTDLLNKLRAASTSQEHFVIKATVSGVVFMFPGQGSQYPGMGKALYEKEPVFRQAFDECAALLLPLMQEDIRQVIFPSNAAGDAADKIHNTYYTQPALFIIEYALARLWMSRGIQPVALLGHSIGEFVAAHLAGVYSLSDGLRLIFARGRLMSALAKGAMLSIRAGEEKILPLLPPELSLAAVNSPLLCVVSGPADTVLEFSRSLQVQGIASKLLQTSHAFHSSMMDPMLADFGKVAASIPMHSPTLPIVSTLTGNWVKDGEISLPSYWVRQLRSPVRFSAAVKTIAADSFPVLLEVGPAHVLSALIRHQGLQKPLLCTGGLDSGSNQSAYHSMLRTAGQLWMYGVPIDWSAFFPSEKKSTLVLPNYAFEKIRCWVDPAPAVIYIPPAMPAADPALHVVETTAATPRETLIYRLRQILEDASGIEMASLGSDSSFIESGFDSLLLTQVALNLKKEFGVPVSFRQLSETLGNLNNLAIFLEGQLAELPAAETNPAVVSSDTAIQILSKQIEALSRQVAGLSGHAAANPSPEEMRELKKPFGASAKIEKKPSGLTRAQQHFLLQLTQRYNQKTKSSKAYAQEHRAFMADPRVVSGFRPFTKELVYPMVVNKSRGSKLWDIDNNEYIDALNGFGSNFLGYQPEIITRALLEQIEKGYELGPQHPLAGEVCRMICDFTNFDRAALCNTGSEAVLGAMRIARTVTGRSTIVAFSGSYHGINDEVIVRGTKNLKSFPAAPGILAGAVENMLILDYGTEESLSVIRQRAKEFAAILVEPVQSRRPEFLPVEFLKALRTITRESGTVLIFDEVITGFRMHPGGFQGMYGIQADLGTYGKVVAGGLPIGVIAGKKTFMDALDGGFWQYGDQSAPESGVTYFAGTFVRHPLALAAAYASLRYMKEKGPALQASLNEKTTRFAGELNRICSQKGLSVYIAQFGSMWKIKFKEEIPYAEILFTLMREKGIHIWDGFPCFLTTAHQDGDVKRMVDAFEESVSEMLDAGFFAASMRVDDPVQIEVPPAPGARLGRDKDGNPAWFITDPNRPGKYLQINE